MSGKGSDEEKMRDKRSDEETFTFTMTRGIEVTENNYTCYHMG